MRPPSGLRGTLLSVGLVCGACSDPRPNVLLVTLDTTRPDYMSAYGYEAGHTPNFDAIGIEGARFDMAISASAVTPVSHASILTGEYPYNHGLRVLSAKGGARLPESNTAENRLIKEHIGETPTCSICGNLMQRNGNCHVCTVCGTTSGCS